MWQIKFFIIPNQDAAPLNGVLFKAGIITNSIYFRFVQKLQFIGILINVHCFYQNGRKK